MSHSHSRYPRLCVAALISLATLAFPAQLLAQSNLGEAQTLLSQGKRTQALEQLDRFITANPKDRQARFLKGVVLTELNRLDDAASVFLKLTEEAPELPEPYNNLAVIYAQQNQFDKAKAALEMAIRTHPSYAVAHENLGDLYARMARQAYDRALQIDSKNTNAQAKLNLLRELGSASARPATPSKPATVAAATPTPPPGSVELRPNTPVVAQSAQASSAVASAALPRASSSASASIASTKASSASSSAASSTPAATNRPGNQEQAPRDDGRKAAQKAVEDWAAAWSEKNVKAYLGFYAKDFEVPAKQGRAAWEKERAERIDKPGSIKVTLTELDVRVSGERAVVRFKQNYQSANFKSASGKTLELTRRDGRWLITKERIGR